MRDIEFRGKDIVCGKWVYGYYYSECGNHYIIENLQKESELNRNIPHQVIPETVGQYTGLKDKDEVYIFEADFVRDEQGTVGQVFYHTEHGSFYWGNGHGLHHNNDLEVIDNIHPRFSKRIIFKSNGRKNGDNA